MASRNNGDFVGSPIRCNQTPSPDSNSVAPVCALGMPVASDGDGPFHPSPVHRHRHQCALGDARVRRPGASGALAGDQAGEDADRVEVRGAPAADRAAEEDRAVAVALLLVEDAEARQRQELVHRAIGVGVVRRPREHRRHDELRVVLGQCVRRRGRARAHASDRGCAPARRRPPAGRRAGPGRPAARGRARRCACCAARCGSRRWRGWSRHSGGSTATTSAPASARSSVDTGPAIPSDRSTIRMPSRMPASEVTPSGATIVSPLAVRRRT